MENWSEAGESFSIVIDKSTCSSVAIGSVSLRSHRRTSPATSTHRRMARQLARHPTHPSSRSRDATPQPGARDHDSSADEDNFKIGVILCTKECARSQQLASRPLALT